MSIAIIILKYLEPEYQQTLDCVKATGLQYFVADRDGVGNMSRAFNDVFIKHVKGKYEKVWFVTNITFDKDVPFKLAKSIAGNIVGVHPAMAGSDHKHLWPGNHGNCITVPFIEFTAPMFSSNIFQYYMLDNHLWHYYMDIELCYRLRNGGYSVAVNHNTSIEHTYLRNNKVPHPVTDLRKKLRQYMAEPNQQYLTNKYGPDWRKLFEWKG